MSSYEVATILGFGLHNHAVITLSGESIDLSMEQLRILSAMVWLDDYRIGFYFPNSCEFRVEGTTLHGRSSYYHHCNERQISWNLTTGVICCSRHNDYHNYYTASTKGIFTTVTQSKEQAQSSDSICTLTFKNGLLHSIDDAPALAIRDRHEVTLSDAMWYREGICYSAVTNMDE